jgi:hypothetical protein
MKELKENWKSTFVGVVIVVSGIASVFLGKSNWTEASIVIVIGVGFILSADAKKK